MKKIDFSKIPSVPHAAVGIMSMVLIRLVPQNFQPKLAARMLSDLASLAAIMRNPDYLADRILEVIEILRKIDTPEQMDKTLANTLIKINCELVEITAGYEAYLEEQKI